MSTTIEILDDLKNAIFFCEGKELSFSDMEIGESEEWEVKTLTYDLNEDICGAKVKMMTHKEMSCDGVQAYTLPVPA
jgi:hypothetical protein